jgi:rhodanese-related sulfurtransferase
MLGGIVWLSLDTCFNSNSFLRNAETVRSYQCHSNRHAPAVVKHSGWDQAVSDGGIVVDCRLPNAFSHGHVPSAVNLPIDSSPQEFQRFLGSHETVLTSNVFVYCQSARCEWDSIMAQRLTCLGAKSVFVVDGGWEVYEERRNTQSEGSNDN